MIDRACTISIATAQRIAKTLRLFRSMTHPAISATLANPEYNFHSLYLPQPSVAQAPTYLILTTSIPPTGNTAPKHLIIFASFTSIQNWNRLLRPHESHPSSTPKRSSRDPKARKYQTLPRPRSASFGPIIAQLSRQERTIMPAIPINPHRQPTLAPR